MSNTFYKQLVVIVLILLGIVVEIINTNAWFIIPDLVSWILFGIAGLCIVFSIINRFVVKISYLGFCLGFLFYALYLTLLTVLMY